MNGPAKISASIALGKPWGSSSAPCGVEEALLISSSPLYPPERLGGGMYPPERSGGGIYKSSSSSTAPESAGESKSGPPSDSSRSFLVGTAIEGRGGRGAGGSESSGSYDRTPKRGSIGSCSSFGSKNGSGE